MASAMAHSGAGMKKGGSICRRKRRGENRHRVIFENSSSPSIAVNGGGSENFEKAA